MKLFCSKFKPIALIVIFVLISNVSFSDKGVFGFSEHDISRVAKNKITHLPTIC